MPHLFYLHSNRLQSEKNKTEGESGKVQGNESRNGDEARESVIRSGNKFVVLNFVDCRDCDRNNETTDKNLKIQDALRY